MTVVGSKCLDGFCWNCFDGVVFVVRNGGFKCTR